MQASGSNLDPWEQDPWEILDIPDEQFSYDDVTPEYAGHQLGDYLLWLKHTHVLSAVHVSILSFWAYKAGACGLVKDIGLAPENQSQHYSRKVDRAMGLMKKSSWYPVMIPQNARMNANRVVERVWTQPLQDAFQKIVDVLDDARNDLACAIEQGRVPPSYHTHPVVVNAEEGEIVVPLMLYVDGVPITRRDGAVGFTLRSILRPDRPYLILALRKEDFCKCGCRGWCTLHTVHMFLRWGLLSLASGRHSDHHWDMSAFGSGTWAGHVCDNKRAALAGKPFSKTGCATIKGACLLLKGDLKELSATWGLPDTSSLEAACPCCHVHGDDFLNFLGFSPLSLPDNAKTFEDYQEACTACEINTPILLWDQFVHMRGELQQDLRRDGARGLALDNPIDALSLLKHDRLEPSASLIDVYSIFDVTEESYTPRSFLFWRRSLETIARHRCVVFDPAYGVTLDLALAFDWLHTVSKGVCQFYVARFFTQAFEVNVCRVVDGPWESVVQASVHIIRSKLFTWYSNEERAGRTHTRLQNLTPNMFGSHESPTFDLHASETNHFLFFMLTLLDEWTDRMPNHVLWRRALDALVTMQRIYDTYQYCNLPDSELQRLCDAISTHYRTCKRLRIASKPKHHILKELAVRSRTLGGLALMATFPDEGLNRVIKGIGGTAHRLNWTMRVLDDFEAAARMGAPTAFQRKRKLR